MSYDLNGQTWKSADSLDKIFMKEYVTYEGRILFKICVVMNSLTELRRSLIAYNAEKRTSQIKCFYPKKKRMSM